MSHNLPASSGVDFRANMEVLRTKLAEMKAKQVKEVCRALGLILKGRKQELIDRIIQCLEIFERNKARVDFLAAQTIILKASLDQPLPPISTLISIISSSNHNFQQFQDSVSQFQQASSLQGSLHRSLYGSHPIGFSTRASPSIPSYGSQIGETYNGPMLMFHRSMFYNLRSMVGPVQVLRPSKGRANKHFTISLTEAQIDILNESSANRIYLFGAPSSTPNKSDVMISFPPIEVHVNGVLTKQYLRGIKGKAGTARPADLTPYVHHRDKPIDVRIIYSDATDQYLLYTYVVEEISPETLVERIQITSHIPPEVTKHEIQEENRRNEEDDMIIDNVSLSTKCPLTYARMKYPMKSTQCEHIQCFDGLSFLTMQSQIPSWQCPVCSKKVDKNSLAISDYMIEILSCTSEDVESVILNADGSWRLASEEEGFKAEPKLLAKGDANHEIVTEHLPADSSIEIISLDSSSEDEGDAPVPRTVPVQNQTLEAEMDETMVTDNIQTQTQICESENTADNSSNAKIQAETIGSDSNFTESLQISTNVGPEGLAKASEAASNNSESPLTQINSNAESSSLSAYINSNQSYSPLSLPTTASSLINAEPVIALTQGQINTSTELPPSGVIEQTEASIESVSNDSATISAHVQDDLYDPEDIPISHLTREKHVIADSLSHTPDPLQSVSNSSADSGQRSIEVIASESSVTKANGPEKIPHVSDLSTNYRRDSECFNGTESNTSGFFSPKSVDQVERDKGTDAELCAKSANRSVHDPVPSSQKISPLDIHTFRRTFSPSSSVEDTRCITDQSNDQAQNGVSILNTIQKQVCHGLKDSCLEDTTVDPIRNDNDDAELSKSYEHFSGEINGSKRLANQPATSVVAERPTAEAMGGAYPNGYKSLHSSPQNSFTFRFNSTGHLPSSKGPTIGPATGLKVHAKDLDNSRQSYQHLVRESSRKISLHNQALAAHPNGSRHFIPQEETFAQNGPLNFASENSIGPRNGGSPQLEGTAYSGTNRYMRSYSDSTAIIPAAHTLNANTSQSFCLRANGTRRNSDLRERDSSQVRNSNFASIQLQSNSQAMERNGVSYRGPESNQRFSRSAFDEFNSDMNRVKGLLGIEVSKDALGAGASDPVSQHIATQPTIRQPNTQSPLNSRIQDMYLQSPAGRKRSIPGSSDHERTWNNKVSRVSKRNRNPVDLNQVEVIELDD